LKVVGDGLVVLIYEADPIDTVTPTAGPAGRRLPALKLISLSPFRRVFPLEITNKNKNKKEADPSDASPLDLL
jgi:hypothetical protein